MSIMSEDDRLDLALMAQASERKHRPRHLVVLATLVLGAGLIGLVWGLTAHRRASAEARRERNNLVMLQRMEAELQAIEAAGQGQAQGPPWDAIPDLKSRLEGFATSAGLAKPALPTESRDRAVPSGGKSAQRMRLSYRVSHSKPEEIMAWIERSLKDVPGLELWRLRMRPEATNWSVEVEFSRWERVGS